MFGRGVALWARCCSWAEVLLFGRGVVGCGLRVGVLGWAWGFGAARGGWPHGAPRNEATSRPSSTKLVDEYEKLVPGLNVRLPVATQLWLISDAGCDARWTRRRRARVAK
eukprot:5236402-Prymnesium_polylepis.1